MKLHIVSHEGILCCVINYKIIITTIIKISTYMLIHIGYPVNMHLVDIYEYLFITNDFINH